MWRVGRRAQSDYWFVQCVCQTLVIVMKCKLLWLTVSPCVFSRPVFPSGGGEVWESCCSSSHSDHLPSFIWHFIYSVFLAGKCRAFSGTGKWEITLLLIFFFFYRGFAVTLLFGKTNSEKHLEKCEHSYLPPTPTGIAKVGTTGFLKNWMACWSNCVCAYFRRPACEVTTLSLLWFSPTVR